MITCRNCDNLFDDDLLFEDHLDEDRSCPRRAWWDSDDAPGYSGDGGQSVPEHTPDSAYDFNQRRTERTTRAEIHKNTRAMAAISTHNTPASKFDGARVLAEGNARVVNPPKVGVKVTTLAPSALGDHKVANVRQPERKSRIEKKEVTAMTTATKNKKNANNPYANVPVVNLTVGAATAAKRFCVTTGRDFNDTDAIKNILQVIQKNDPAAVITNQGRWDGDMLVGKTAESIGLQYVETLPKFIEARRRRMPLIADGERMTPEQDAEFGYRELQNRLAETCIELHVFGTPSGPQRGLIEAFNDVEKKSYGWGASTD